MATVIHCRSNAEIQLDRLIEMEGLAKELRKMHQERNQATLLADRIMRAVENKLAGVPDAFDLWQATHSYQVCATYHHRMVCNKTAWARAHPFGR